MANNNSTPSQDMITAARVAKRELREKERIGLTQRKRSNVILSADDLSGEYDTARLLMTTLGGQIRMITQEDLRNFRHSVRVLQKKFTGGITAKQAIDLSMPGRIESANKQIRTAIPISSKGGRFLFQTNAGPDSKYARHMVTVEFMNFSAALASPVKSLKITNEVIKGKIKLECDCEDWRYRFRFLASTAQYAAGPWYEHGFTKITNPTLDGCACKHILRVCQLVTGSATFRGYMAKSLDKARSQVEARRSDAKISEMKEMAERLAKERAKKGARVTTTDERKQLKEIRKQRSGGKQAVHPAVAKVKIKVAAKAKQMAEKQAKSAIKGVEANVKKLLALGAINEEQANAMLLAMRNK